jgi:hypothetical protein
MDSSTGKPTNGARWHPGSTPGISTARAKTANDGTAGVLAPSTRSITDRTDGYEPSDGEFDSPRVYMCRWCEGKAEYRGVFGSLITMEIWDVPLCQYHADTVSRQHNSEPIWAPSYTKEANNQDHYADEWMIIEMV